MTKTIGQQIIEEWQKQFQGTVEEPFKNLAEMIDIEIAKAEIKGYIDALNKAQEINDKILNEVLGGTGKNP